MKQKHSFPEIDMQQFGEYHGAKIYNSTQVHTHMKLLFIKYMIDIYVY